MHQKGMETAALYHRLRSALDSSEIDPCIIYEEALLGGWRDLSELALRRLSVVSRSLLRIRDNELKDDSRRI